MPALPWGSEKAKGERLTWEWFICVKIDHAKSKTKKIMKVHWRG